MDVQDDVRPQVPADRPGRARAGRRPLPQSRHRLEQPHAGARHLMISDVEPLFVPITEKKVPPPGKAPQTLYVLLNRIYCTIIDPYR